MKLDEYLEALEKSSDEELTKLGVDNNYLIILKAKYDEVKSDLSKIFKLKEGVKFFSGGEMFEYISGSVEAHIFEGAVSWSLDEKERVWASRETKRVDKGLSDCGCNADFRPGLVFDPFGGSGTTMKTARKLGRIGVSLDLGYHELSSERSKTTQLSWNDCYESM